MIRKIYLYGFEGTRVVSYRYIKEEFFSVRSIKVFLDDMLGDSPDIDGVYMVDNRQGLRDDFMDAVLRRHFSKDVEFKDLIALEGILIFRR